MRPGNASRTVRYLVVRLAGKEFALNADAVLGLVQMRGLAWRDCQGPPGWRGMVDFQGKPLPVYWPANLAGVDQRPTGPRTCLVLLGARETPQDVSWALRVDSVSRYEEINRALIRDEGKVRLNGKWRPILDVSEIWRAWLLDDPQSIPRSTTTMLSTLGPF